MLLFTQDYIYIQIIPKDRYIKMINVIINDVIDRISGREPFDRGCA